MVESFFKGAILLFTKDAVMRASTNIGANEVSAGLIGGFFGGVSQVSVIGPCTFLVTAAVTGDKSITTLQRVKSTYSAQGLPGFYRGGAALMMRQGTNWMSRQGFTDAIRVGLKNYFHGDKSAKLTVSEEILAGIVGGTLSTWNQPFEVMRIQAQAEGNAII